MEDVVGSLQEVTWHPPHLAPPGSQAPQAVSPLPPEVVVGEPNAVLVLPTKGLPKRPSTVVPLLPSDGLGLPGDLVGRRGSGDAADGGRPGTLGMARLPSTASAKEKFRTKTLTIVDENHYAMFLHSVVLVGQTAPLVAKCVEAFAESQKKTGLGQYDNGVAVLCSWEIPEADLDVEAGGESGGRSANRGSVSAEGEASAGKKWSRLRIETRDYSFQSSFPDMNNIEQASNTAIVFLVEPDCDVSDIKSKVMEANIQRHVPLLLLQPLSCETLEPALSSMKQVTCLSPVRSDDAEAFYRRFCDVCELLSQNRARSQSAAAVFGKAVTHKVQAGTRRSLGCCRRRTYKV
mmetsp:Transcript_72848/g.167250  ORF Transcript_72848/g.167250 Transcript_72848/m.167250 type:complete len:348 (+) Transcript_72848:265-1308(+)